MRRQSARPFTPTDIAWMLSAKRAGRSNTKIAQDMDRHRTVVDEVMRRWRGFAPDAELILAEMQRRRDHSILATVAKVKASPNPGVEWRPAKRLDEAAVAALHRAHGGFQDVRFKPWPRAPK